jgi:hypothetical protein
MSDRHRHTKLACFFNKGAKLARGKPLEFINIHVKLTAFFLCCICSGEGGHEQLANYERPNNPTATLLEHTSLSQGFMSTSKAVSLVAGDRKIVMLRGRFWATYPSVAVGVTTC